MSATAQNPASSAIAPEQIQQLVSQAEQLAADAEDLDELVIEIACRSTGLNDGPEGEAECRMAAAEAQASRVNNAGLAAQVAYLYQCGVSLADIRSALGIAAVAGDEISAVLASSEHGFDDFDVTGHACVRRACVPHGIQLGDQFNVYHGESSKSGCMWDGGLISSLRKFAAQEHGV
ncbi:hypothetical protein [Aquipseudomonas alcaligenes]|uniref:Uncharacterized protein n=1 Tax=Aquipseudomonas alcaligenes TaxID=43263 RepID=A0A1N6X7R6_AQUAC|nr:hypothetical protein [Pseudomonas alcaligenes]SIQ98394.1 hypothetical protein SAMN05878282_11210 [Pseudomonas alcaligenes]